MTLKHRKTDGLIGRSISVNELRRLMADVISLREKVAQAELDHGEYRALRGGSKPLASPETHHPADQH